MRSRLFLLVLIASTPAWLVAVYASARRFSAATATTYNEARHAMRLGVNENAQVVTNGLQTLRSIAALAQTRTASEICGEMRLLQIVGALVSTSAGVRCRTDGGSDALTHAERNALSKALETRDGGQGDYVPVNGGHSSVQPMASLVMARDEKLVVVVNVQLTWIRQLRERLDLPNGTVLAVVTPTGQVIAASGVPTHSLDKNVNGCRLSNIPLGRESTVEIRGSDGVRRAYAIGQLNQTPAIPYYFAVGVPIEAGTRDAAEALRRNLFACLAATLVMLSVAYIAGDRYILRRLRLLSQTARRITKGQLSANTELEEERDELSVIGRALDDLANRIQTQQEAASRLANEVQAQESEMGVANVMLKAQQESLHMLSQELMRVQETEREHIARELHDDIGQNLTAVNINLQIVKTHHPELSSTIDQCILSLERILKSVRDLSLDLRPPLIDEMGLVAALRWYLANQFGKPEELQVELESSVDESRMLPEVKLAIFRIIQEAITNIIRHANARTARVSLTETDSHVELTIEDDGRGFDVFRFRQGHPRRVTLGVIGMQERAAQMGAELAIESNPGAGTTVRVLIPVSTIVS